MMCQNNTQEYFKILDFPGGTVDKNSPVNAENMGSISGLGGFHMPVCMWAAKPMCHSY